MSCDGWINIERDVNIQKAENPHLTCYECGKPIYEDAEENKKVHRKCRKVKRDDGLGDHLRVSEHDLHHHVDNFFSNG